MHPIDTLKKVLSGDWLVELLKTGFNNPANAFTFGALAAMVYNFVEKYVFPVVDHYVVVPALRVIRNVMRWLDPNTPGTIAHAIMGLIDLVKHPIEFLRDLVKPFDGVGNSLILRIFMNFAKKVGVDFPLAFAKLLANNADTILKTIIDLHQSPFLTSFAGSSRMSWLLTPMLYASMVAGNALGKIYKTDGKEDGRLSFSERITRALGVSKTKVANAVVGRFMKAGMSAKELETARGNINALAGELDLLLGLDDTIQALSRQDLDAITGDVKAQFTKSNVFGRGLLEDILDQISKEMYGGKFDLLGKERQLVVLRTMLELRQKKVDALYELYRSNDIEKNRVA